MTAGLVTLICTPNQEFTAEIKALNPDGSYMYLSAYSAIMHIRRRVSSDLFEIELTSDNGKIILDTSNSSITLNISAQEISRLHTGEYVYDLKLYNSSRTSVIRLIKGKFIVR